MKEREGLRQLRMGLGEATPPPGRCSVQIVSLCQPLRVSQLLEEDETFPTERLHPFHVVQVEHHFCSSNEDLRPYGWTASLACHQRTIKEGSPLPQIAPEIPVPEQSATQTQ